MIQELKSFAVSNNYLVVKTEAELVNCYTELF